MAAGPYNIGGVVSKIKTQSDGNKRYKYFALFRDTVHN